MTTAVRQAPHHRNTVCVLIYGCQLPDCRARFNNRRRAIKAGTLQPSRILIDATPVREHILELRDARMSLTCIAKQAGVAHTTICAIVHGRPQNRRGRQRVTTPETAAKILAVRPLTAIGALRRIHACTAAGWPGRRIAVRAGVSGHWIVDLQPDTPILISSAEKIAAVYDELRHLIPEEHGVWPGHANRARQHAKASRWPDFDYWDQHPGDIDDPHFEPMYGITRRLIVAQDANELMRFSGLDRAAAAERLGISKAYIDHAFRDHPEYAVEVAA
ncbi:hypothetical protein ABT119_06275 [Streptomyces sp. NPDC001910]|uniref:hypothetical protein n=1 Tax=Streptomyces sp. NPDC001910 TaxID=3154403 RepID=UPI003320A076